MRKLGRIAYFVAALAFLFAACAVSPRPHYPYWGGVVAIFLLVNYFVLYRWQLKDGKADRRLGLKMSVNPPFRRLDP